ncbi:hypothetical protein EVAR_42065_1 [Eumeta japonica]|uniref:Uncharacterized protein n=1 Tax=Eumeta variegata TaxID=151549 RepID=A0A4C1XT90_EUMVA|nr:hypothetical protein EVAR_42065_1 [Eumeta japonica]
MLAAYERLADDRRLSALDVIQSFELIPFQISFVSRSSVLSRTRAEQSASAYYASARPLQIPPSEPARFTSEISPASRMRNPGNSELRNYKQTYYFNRHANRHPGAVSLCTREVLELHSTKPGDDNHEGTALKLQEPHGCSICPYRGIKWNILVHESGPVIAAEEIQRREHSKRSTKHTLPNKYKSREKNPLSPRNSGREKGQVLTVHEVRGLTSEGTISCGPRRNKNHTTMVVKTRHTVSCVYYADDGEDASDRFVKRAVAARKNKIKDNYTKIVIRNRDKTIMNVLAEN